MGSMASHPAQPSDRSILAQSPPPAAEDEATGRQVAQSSSLTAAAQGSPAIEARVDGLPAEPEPQATVVGATKADAECWHFYLDLAAQDAKEEPNEARRQNAQVALEFLTRHGYPAKGYKFLAHHGIMEVMSDECPRTAALSIALGKRVGPWADTYGLVSCYLFRRHPPPMPILV